MTDPEHPQESRRAGGGPESLPPAVARVEQHYDEHAAHPGMDTGGRDAVLALPITRAILDWAGRGERVLDLGCHHGDITVLLGEAGNEVVGVDLPRMVEVARARHGLEAIAHDLNRPFPFEERRFDLVIAASVLDDIVDDVGFLRECRRVLVPGGRLVVVVPNEVSLFRRVQALLGRSSRDRWTPTGYHGLHRYTLRGIRALLEGTGFEVEEVRKCPKRHSRIPLRYTVERLLPATFATDLALRARRREDAPGPRSP